MAGAVDGLLEEARKRNELNFYELELIRRCAADRVPFDEVHLLRLRVDDPSRAIADPAAAPALEFTFGFALTHRQQFVYFRVQDHLRRGILRAVRTPEDLRAIRGGLSLDGGISLSLLDARFVAFLNSLKADWDVTWQQEQKDPLIRS